MAKYSALDVAAWFLANRVLREMEGEDEDGITNMKLQKLLYYAQGCNLALEGVPLFDELLVAWQHGPVVISVYEAYKSYGRCPIEAICGGRPELIDQDDSDTLEQVWDEFGCYTASKLRRMTHEETPWKDAIAKRLGEPLNLKTMEEYFKEHYVVPLDA